MLTAPHFTSARAEAPPAAGWIRVHPRYRAWLQKCGLRTAADALALRGEVVCGHADRHVVKIELDSGVSTRGAYLKREHVVGRRARLRNWREGFGWVSRAEREARTLQKLEDLGLPAPQWLAHGEDAGGRAFLLVEGLTGTAPLREFLADNAVSATDRRLFAERLGRVLAECHAAGIGTPELAAKHILVRPDALHPTLLDWQSGSLNRPVTAAQAAAWLGTLHATLPADSATTRERLRMLWAYRRVLKAEGKSPPTRFSECVRSIRESSRKAAARSSVRHQLAPQKASSQRLVWLDGEALVAVPEVADRWDTGFDALPVYEGSAGTEPIALPCGSSGELLRFRTSAPLGFIAAALRERPWRSPGATAARVLFHLQRFGIAGPELLAFGQRPASAWSVPSFVLARPPEALRPLEETLAADNPSRNRTLADLGHFLKRLHDARCRPLRRLLGIDPLLTLSLELAVTSPLGVRIVRRVSAREARADLRYALAGFDRLDKMRVLRSYLGSRAAERGIWERFAKAVL